MTQLRWFVDKDGNKELQQHTATGWLPVEVELNPNHPFVPKLKTRDQYLVLCGMQAAPEFSLEGDALHIKMKAGPFSLWSENEAGDRIIEARRSGCVSYGEFFSYVNNPERLRI